MALTVLAAVYGTPGIGFDVTNDCQAIVGSSNSIPVNSTTFAEPALGPKYFGILYVYPTLNNGNPIALACPDNTSLNLVPTPPTATTSLQQP